MKKKTIIIAVAAMALLFYVGYTKKTQENDKLENFVFTATVVNIEKKAIEVTTTDAYFDSAIVNYDESVSIDFPIKVGQKIEIEALPQVGMSIPAYVNAVNIKLIEE